MYDKKSINVKFPSQEEILAKFNNFFIMEKDEKGEDKYSKINYYYYTDEEKKMIEDKNINIKYNDKEIKFNLDLKIDDIYTAIDEFE